MIALRPRSRSTATLTAATVVLFTIFICFQFQSILNGDYPRVERELQTPLVDHAEDVEIVVASMQQENTTWVLEYFPDWRKSIYVVDDPGARLSVPINKGKEAMVYLTYIIDRYDTLPNNILFHHSGRFQWHNDDPDYDAHSVLRRFQFSYLQAKGYVNLRCVWTLGCPAEIRPFADEATVFEGQPTTKQIFKRAFSELMPELEVPEIVAVSCCSQFAVTKEVILRRPKEDYVRFRQWLIDTPMDDSLSGRVFEYSWHIMFGKEAVHCPSAKDCYCNVFGMCDLVCNEGKCQGRYTLPAHATLPKGWPKFGWEQEERIFSGPL